jgi:hypothetical protein
MPPKYPDAPLLPTPAAITGPTDRSKKLLGQVCEAAIKGGDFSVARCPFECDVPKNDFLALKPYFWETEPGKWGKCLRIWVCGGLTLTADRRTSRRPP